MSSHTGPLAVVRLGRLPTRRAIWIAGAGIVMGVALVVVPVHVVAWVAVGAALVGVAYVAPLAAVCLIPWTAAFGALLTVTVHGFNATPTDALVAALMLAYLGHAAQDAVLSRLSTPRPTLSAARAWLVGAWHRDAARVALFAALLVYLAVVVLSLKVATDRASALKEAVKWTEVVAALGLAVWGIRSAAHVRLIAWSAIAAGLAEALLGYAQWAMSSGQAGVDASLRVYGTFGQPNPFAGYLNLSLPLALALVLFGTDARERWLASAAGVILFGSEWLSASRGGLIGLTAALAVLLIVGYRRERAAGIAVAVGVPLIALGLIAHLIPSRLTNAALRVLRLNDVSINGPVTSANFSTMERLAHWIAGLSMFRAHLVLGVGAGNYDAAYPRYATDLTTWPEALGHAHNYYINTAAETGILGFLAFAAVTVSMLWVGWCATHPAHPTSPAAVESDAKPGEPPATVPAAAPVRALALGFFAVIAALLAHNLTDDLFVHGMDLQVALSLACLVFLSGYRRDSA